MDRSAIEYLNYLENSDPFFYKNFNDFIVYASSLNKNLKDNEYKQLKESKDSDYKITLKDKKTTINIIKNFFYKISPNIIKQIDYDVANNNIVFLNRDQMGNSSSRITLSGDNYKIEILESSKIEESYLLVREYAHLFAGNLLDAEGYDRGLKKVYVEAITSLTEFALAKHLSTNKALKNDSINYINKKIYDSIYNMNDSYLTLTYLGYLLEGRGHDEIVRLLGSEEIVDKLDAIVRGKKPCNDYICTLGTMMAIKEADRTTNIFERINTFYIKAVSQDFKYFNDNMILDLDQKNAVNDIGIYLASNK